MDKIPFGGLRLRNRLSGKASLRHRSAQRLPDGLPAASLLKEWRRTVALHLLDGAKFERADEAATWS
jgi:hypothetical protein